MTKRKIIAHPVQPANDPVLIIVMRNDLASLNPGKACAQASHAANMMNDFVLAYNTAYWNATLEKWKRESGQGFGTCLVLSGSWDIIEDCLNNWNPTNTLSGRVLDYTYPLRDGLITHEFPLHTCAWFFGDREELFNIRNAFELMQ